jgi:hypothetical protein
MSVALTRRWNRVLTFAVTLAVGLATLAIPAAKPVEAAAPPDLVVVGGTNITQDIDGPLVHIFYVNLTGGTVVAAGQIGAVAFFPSGVQPNKVLATGPVGWDCTQGTSFVACKNHGALSPGLGATRFRVELKPLTAPLTGNISSGVDLANQIAESNENNNLIVTTYNFVQ